MTKQNDRTGPTRGRAAKSPAAAAVPPVEEKVSPIKETLSSEESLEEEVVSLAAPVVVEAATEVVPVPAPAEAPAKIVLLASEVDATTRDEPFSFSNRSLEFWKENAQAVYRLAGELGSARTPGELIEAQTKFAVERLRAFGRHAEAIATVRSRFFFAA